MQHRARGTRPLLGASQLCLTFAWGIALTHPREPLSEGETDVQALDKLQASPQCLSGIEFGFVIFNG